MNITGIENYLNEYIKQDNPQYAVMLKGKWGCGKTFFIKQLADKWQVEPRAEERIELQPIYISLNGVSSCSAISFLIKRALYPILYSKGAQVAKKVICGTITALSKSLIDLSKDGNVDDLSSIFDTEMILDILSKPNASVSGNKILIFDDIERSKLSTDELFGYINNLVEHSGCKVILVCEEEKLKLLCDQPDSKIKYDEFKEKLIGKTISFEHDLYSIVKSMSEKSGNKYLQDNSELIAKLFIASQVQNLRIIKQFISDFKILLTEIEPSKYDPILFEKFAQNVITYFTISYCEYKSGDTTFHEYFQTFHFSKTDEDKNRIRSYEQKYNGILAKYGIQRSEYGIRLADIVYYIENGSIQNLQDILFANNILNGRPLADWEKLIQYAGLTSKEFYTTYKNVKDSFYRGEIDYVSIVIHVVGLLLKFNSMSISKCSIKYIEKKAIQQIDSIYAKFSHSTDFKNRIDVGRHGAAWGAMYTAIDTPEIKNILNYAIEKRAKYFKTLDSNYCKDFWEYINNDKAVNIGKYFNEIITEGNATYMQKEIFENVNIAVVAKAICNLSFDSKLFIKDFFEYRYQNHPHLLSKECAYLQILTEQLQRYTKRQNSFDRAGTSEIINTVINIISLQKK